MSQRSHELYLALATALLVGVWYVAVAQTGVPRSSGLIGLGLGILGFVMMLGAETLYTWRKQRKGAGWGKMSWWLQLHVYLGLVGPFLVLLHSAWRLNGLAGATMLLTLLMVASGFLCSYIYTAMPRTVEGAEVAQRDLEAQLASLHAQLQHWSADKAVAVSALVERLVGQSAPTPKRGTGSVLGRTLLHWRYRRQVRRELRQLDSGGQMQSRELRELVQLLDRHNRLALQAQTLAAARRLLGQTRTLHILLGAVLFALAFVHIGAALYYATFAH